MKAGLRISIILFFCPLFISFSTEVSRASSPDNLRRVKTPATKEFYSILSPEEVARLDIPEILHQPHPLVTRDHEGKLFYVYQWFHGSQDPDFYWGYNKKIFFELQAYNEGKAIFNLVETRIRKYEEIRDTELGRWMQQNGYDIIGMSRILNDYKFEELKFKQGSPTWIIVFYTYIRDRNDHLKTDPRIGGRPRDLRILKVEGKEHYLSNDHDDSLMLYEDYVWEIENFVQEILSHSRHITWDWIFKEILDYAQIAELVFRLQISRTDAQIRNNLNGPGLELLPEVKNRRIELLFSSRDMLRLDIEYFVWKAKKEDINLSDFLEKSSYFNPNVVIKLLTKELARIETKLRKDKENPYLSPDDRVFWLRKLKQVLTDLTKYQGN